MEGRGETLRVRLSGLVAASGGQLCESEFEHESDSATIEALVFVLALAPPNPAKPGRQAAMPREPSSRPSRPSRPSRSKQCFLHGPPWPSMVKSS
jgi:hypothetical protein